MDCTRLNLEKRIVYRGLVLLLLLALVWQCGLLFPALGHRVWAESLVPGPRRRHSRCYSRYRQACWDFWMRRVQVLLCRVGLVTGLLLWSGCAQRQPASWALLSVPVVDAWLPLLAVTWPRLAHSRGYRYGVRGLHQLYLVALAWLVGQGLTTAPTGVAGLLLVSGTVKTADGAQARGWIDADGTWHLELTGEVF
ncbi:MAG: hypothetical protein ACE5F6_11315, partial [Anaerolineae bacterium]